ncbi:MAG: hypothetical protein CMP08_01110 [Xanthomonadales bacterium]|nr:hypothetical protein [Xanthomonadales bacterium]
MRVRDIDLLLYQGESADATGGGLDGAVQLAGVFERRLGVAPQRIGQRSVRTSANQLEDWHDQLVDMGNGLEQAAAGWAKSLRGHRRIIGLLPRCSVAMATLPEVFKRHPRARLLWIDAHPDLNTSQESSSGYLGGMALAAAIGRWDSGLGAAVPVDQVALVGARDIDAAEQVYIDASGIRRVAIDGFDVAALADWLGNAPVYIHLDCDVFDPACVPADYAVDHGIGFSELARVLQVINPERVVGVEIAELAATWADGRQAPTQRLVDSFMRLVN